MKSIVRIPIDNYIGLLKHGQLLKALLEAHIVHYNKEIDLSAASIRVETMRISVILVVKMEYSYTRSGQLQGHRPRAIQLLECRHRRVVSTPKNNF